MRWFLYSKKKGPHPEEAAQRQSRRTHRGSSSRLGTAPETLGGDLGAFGHRAQLFERDVGIELAVAGEGAKTAIGAGNDALAPDDVGEAADSLRDEFGMLDIIGRGVEDARDEDLVVGQLGFLPDRPFMLVPRVGGFDDERL